MKLVYPHDVPHVGIVRTFRHSRVTPFVLLVIIGGGTAWWVIAVALSERSQWMHWLPAMLGGLMCVVVLIYLRKALKATNWLLRVTEDGLYIKFRSYLNDGYPETGPTIVHIPYSDIAEVRMGKRTLILPDTEGRTTTSALRYLEIDLRHQRTGELSEALRAERAMPPMTNRVAKHHDYPLHLAAPDRLRLDWKVRPGLPAAIQALQRFVSVGAEAVSKISWAALNDDAKGALIVELVELGERIRATRLAQELYDLSKEEAKIYIDELAGHTGP